MSAASRIRAPQSADCVRPQRAVALMHRMEHWRERLLAEGDVALAELLDEYPQADRQQLRTLVRNALAEKAKNKPPRAFREIYQVLRELMLPAHAAVGAGDADEEDTEHEFDDEADERG